MKFWWRLLIYLSVLLLSQEIILRICFPIPELSNFDRINYMVLDQSEGRPKFLRNQTYYWQSSPDTVHRFVNEMNSHGFRYAEWTIEKDPTRKRLLVVGVSMLEGLMA